MKSLILSSMVATMLLSGSAFAVDGTKRFKKVLDGVMYFGGGKQLSGRSNQNPLEDATLTRLCNGGFSESIYLYSTNFKTAPRNTACSAGSLSYRMFDARKPDPILKRIYDIAMNPSKGPVYIHCWNGIHASNGIAALSLMQFCGWSKDRAKSYWLKRAKESNFNKYGKGVRNRINNFKLNKSIELPASVQNQICP